MVALSKDHVAISGSEVKRFFRVWQSEQPDQHLGCAFYNHFQLHRYHHIDPKLFSSVEWQIRKAIESMTDWGQ